MFYGHDVKPIKAAKLVNELQRALDNKDNPEQYLIDICRVLTEVGKGQFTDIVNKLSK